jgi:hypothetical protein
LETIYNNTPFIAFVTGFGYCVTIIMCMTFYLRIETFIEENHILPHRLTLLFIAIILSIILIVKIFDLDIRLTELVRMLSKTHGWYEDRRAFQLMISVVIIISGILIIIRLENTNYHVWRHYNLTLPSMLILVGYNIINTLSFHLVDQILHKYICGVAVYRMFDLIIIYWIMISLIIDYMHLVQKRLSGKAEPSVSRFL